MTQPGRELLDRLGARIWTVDAHTLKTTFVSAALADLLGVSDARALSLEDTVPDADRAAVLAAYREVAASGSLRSIEQHVLPAGGRAVRVAAELRALRGRSGAVSEIAATFVELPPEADGVRALLADAFDSRPEGLLLIGAGGKIVAWNERFAQLFGVPLELHDAGKIPDLLRAQLEDGAGFADAMDRPPGPGADRLVRCHDGRTLERSARRFRGGWLWSFRDVSEQLRIAETIRESEERYRDLYNKTPVMMHSIDASGRLVSVSDMWLRTLGYERDEVLGRPSVDFLAPESRRYALEVVLPEFFRTGVCTDVPYRIRKKDGEHVDVLLSAIAERDPGGSHQRSLAVLIDVTRRRQAEAERDRLLVREREARESAESALALLDTLFRTAPVGLAFLDRELRYVRVNETLARTFHGISPEVSEGRTVWQAIPAMAPTIVPLLLRVIETGRAITNLEVTGPMPSGTSEVRSALASYYPVRTVEQEVIGVGVVAVDVTEQKRAASLQAQLYREAQEAVRLRDEFFAIVSHELRTPMTPLVIHLQILLQRARSGEPVDATMIEKAIRQIARLRALIDDMLDSARVATGSLTLTRERVRLRALVEETVAAARVAASRHPIDLHVAAGDPIVLGDPRRIAQVVSNLIENALKYSHSGTTITVSLVQRDGEALISVTDRGIGIPAEEIPKLFQRFFRARNAPVRHYGGLGLGLYICRDIVERHGGRIWVESQLRAGSTFHVALPLSA